MFVKGVIFDSKDHPEGLATLIIANSCNIGCENCCNEHLKDKESYDVNPKELLEFIHKSSFNNYVVLGGLEWTEQIDDLCLLLDLFDKENINCILYTGLSEDEVTKKYPKILNYNLLVKFGSYQKDLDERHCSFDIPLASSNQYIKRFHKLIVDIN
jgi:pyruvate-formate lyase-activating enzyme